MIPTAPRARVSDKIQQDFDVWARAMGRPANARLFLRLALIEPGFQLALSLRLQEALVRLPVVGHLLRRLLWYATTIWTGCHIGPGVAIGGGLYLPHPIGIVIGAEATVGSDVAIYQQVTLGRRDPAMAGAPSIGDHCRLSAGAKILGPVVIGDGATIGANAVVLIDVPPGRTAIGVPARLAAARSTNRDAMP